MGGFNAAVGKKEVMADLSKMLNLAEKLDPAKDRAKLEEACKLLKQAMEELKK